MSQSPTHSATLPSATECNVPLNLNSGATAVIRCYDANDLVVSSMSQEDCVKVLMAYSGVPSLSAWADRMLNGDCDYFMLADGEYLLWDTVTDRVPMLSAGDIVEVIE